LNLLDFALTRGWYGFEFPQVRIFYTAANLPEFIGIAERGRATSSAGWMIVRLTYDSNNMVTTKLAAKRNQILDDRVSLEYS